MGDLIKRFTPNDQACVHARRRTPINPAAYTEVGPFAIYTNMGFHDCGIVELADAVKMFVRYAHPVTHTWGAASILCDYDGVCVLGWIVNGEPDDPVRWFGIPKAAKLFADHPLVDPLEAETVMDKVLQPI